MPYNENSRKNLQPVKAGEVRNPAGRGKDTLNSKTILQKFMQLTIEQTNPFTKLKEDLTVLELLHLKQLANALAGDLAAYRELLDRYEGKVVNKIESENKHEVKEFTVEIIDNIKQNED